MPGSGVPWRSGEPFLRGMSRHTFRTRSIALRWQSLVRRGLVFRRPESGDYLALSNLMRSLMG